MTEHAGHAALAALRNVRNVRAFAPGPVPEDAVDAILEVARLTGSAMNAQPWEFVVVRDRERIAEIAATGPNLGWLAGAPLVICLVMAGERPETERFDEGRLAERIMIAANALGLGAGVGWFFGAGGMARGRAVLGAPEPRTARTVIAIGRSASGLHQAAAERKPLAEIVHRDRYDRPAE